MNESFNSTTIVPSAAYSDRHVVHGALERRVGGQRLRLTRAAVRHLIRLLFLLLFLCVCVALTLLRVR